MRNLSRTTTLIGAAVALAIVVALVVTLWPGSSPMTLTADFPRTVSLYQGSDVRILGVSVGKVDSVTPVGTQVRVTMHYDSKYKVPADAKAVIISPSIVGDRFVQLTPAYTSGPAMSNNANLPESRTATPLELDEIFSALNSLNIALGPDGANKTDTGGTGPLTRLLDSTARNFGGQGVQFNQTLKNLGAFTQTLSDNKDELFGTLNKVEQFTNTLATNDSTVRRFNDSLTAGANLLAGERQDLAAVLKNLRIAMVQVRSFVAQNRSALSSNIAGLNQISRTLVKRRTALDEILRVAPDALNNLFLSGNVPQGTLDTRTNLGANISQLTSNPAEVLCSFAAQADKSGSTCKAIQAALGSGAGLPRPATFAGDPSTAPRVAEPIDPTMGGLLGASK